jgi:hypothetical protein
VLKHFSLGPVLSPRLDAANATESLERSRWQYGVVAAAKAFEQARSGYGASQVFLASGIGVVAGVALTGLPLLVQFLIGGVAGLAVYWGVPTAWAGVGWLRASTVQRDEAREYARALEAYNHEYAQSAARREIAFTFRHDALEDARRLSEAEPRLMGSVSDEEERWRSILAAVARQIEDNGGEMSASMESQLTALADRSPYPSDISRIRNSMLSAGQNLLGEMRNQPAPAAPTPPRPEATGRAFQ